MKLNKNLVEPNNPTMRATFSLAWPLAINAMLLYGIVILDSYLVSKLGETALAAMGLATAVSGLLLGALVALSRATQILVAQAKGANDALALKTALYCAVVIGVLIAIVGNMCLWLLGPYLSAWLAHTPDIAANTMAYLNIFSIVILCEAVSQAISCHFNGTGNTRLPFYSHLVEMPINIGLSVLLIFGLYGWPELGLQGAAIGSAVAALGRLLFLAVCLKQVESALLALKGWTQTTFRASITRHSVLALPVGITFFGVAACNSVSALLYARMDLNEFAAMTLISPWIYVVGMAITAWCQATGIFTGQLLGARATDQKLNAYLLQSWKAMLVVAAGVSCLYWVASILFPVLYHDLQAETLEALWSFVPALLLIPFPKSSNAMCGNVLRAGGDTVAVMNIHLFSQWVFRVPLIVLFVVYLNWSVTWVFALLLFEELVKFPLFHWRFFRGKWRVIV